MLKEKSLLVYVTSVTKDLGFIFQSMDCQTLYIILFFTKYKIRRFDMTAKKSTILKNQNEVNLSKYRSHAALSHEQNPFGIVTYKRL